MNLSPKEVAELRRQIEQLSQRNTKLAGLLQQSRQKLGEMAADLSQLAEPASSYGVFLEFSTGASGAHSTSLRPDAEIITQGRRMRVKISPQVDYSGLVTGQRVRLGDGMVIVEACGTDNTGQIRTVSNILSPQRAVVSNSAGEELVSVVAHPLQGTLKVGDTVVVDSKANVVLEHVDHADVVSLSLEEVPEVSYEDIGGLDAQISMIRDSVELPFVHPELYSKFELDPPKGVLLYGPPGCGKTLIAKAVAHSLASSLGSDEPSYFINVKGPELLNKYVGETERRIRQIFERARELASRESASKRPVVIFFDEMESIFRTRGTGVSSDVETTVVPQLLTELDGVEDLHNVIVIGATNREELIDPAIMRPGRLDIKIKINRPTKHGARDIFARHFPDSIPHEGELSELIDYAVHELYSERPFVSLNFRGGGSRVLHYRDFVSGAMIANIMARAKKLAIKDGLSGDTTPVVRRSHLAQAIAAEQAESEHVPTSTNPDDWAKIVGGTQGILQSVESVDFVGFRSATWHA